MALKNGIKQGEKNKQIEIAKKMLQNNMNIDEIINLTGLSVEDLNKIK